MINTPAIEPICGESTKVRLLSLVQGTRFPSGHRAPGTKAGAHGHNEAIRMAGRKGGRGEGEGREGRGEGVSRPA